MSRLYATIKTQNENFLTATVVMNEETAREYFTENINTTLYPVDIQFSNECPDILLLDGDFSTMKPSKVKSCIAIAAKNAEIEYYEMELERVKKEYFALLEG